MNLFSFHFLIGGVAGAGRGRGMGRGGGRGFRDNSVIGQTVRIAKGPFKGMIYSID